ncbi:MAG: YabP/YqfC family sporulation protein [Clostridia bacterium]|nr:YabP/YqfC family sporulation protein [Clostridia bacterium]
MGLYAEMGKLFAKTVSPYRVTFFSGCAFIEGVKRVLKCTPSEVRVQTAEGALTVTGQGVWVRLLEGEDLLLSGKITGVSLS